MRIIAHTKYGVFQSKETEFTPTEYEKSTKFLEQIHNLEFISFETDDGELYMTKEMISDSLFIIQK